MILQRSYRNVLSILQGCYRYDTSIIWACYRGVTGELQEGLQGCYQGVTDFCNRVSTGLLRRFDMGFIEMLYRCYIGDNGSYMGFTEVILF